MAQVLYPLNLFSDARYRYKPQHRRTGSPRLYLHFRTLHYTSHHLRFGIHRCSNHHLRSGTLPGRLLNNTHLPDRLLNRFRENTLLPAALLVLYLPSVLHHHLINKYHRQHCLVIHLLS
ncbi:hypothetical protein K440DRAFT_626752 [Wilcoxina mikolae CBS 423.85]|nr:hypothetical protein K440DRAFT_626752 [Wilcoxina mikolae CBS 423.85]